MLRRVSFFVFEFGLNGTQKRILEYFMHPEIIFIEFRIYRVLVESGLIEIDFIIFIYYCSVTL